MDGIQNGYQTLYTNCFHTIKISSNYCCCVHGTNVVFIVWMTHRSTRRMRHMTYMRVTQNEWIVSWFVHLSALMHVSIKAATLATESISGRCLLCCSVSVAFRQQRILYMILSSTLWNILCFPFSSVGFFNSLLTGMPDADVCYNCRMQGHWSREWPLHID